MFGNAQENSQLAIVTKCCGHLASLACWPYCSLVHLHSSLLIMDPLLGPRPSAAFRASRAADRAVRFAELAASDRATLRAEGRLDPEGNAYMAYRAARTARIAAAETIASGGSVAEMLATSISAREAATAAAMAQAASRVSRIKSLLDELESI